MYHFSASDVLFQLLPIHIALYYLILSLAFDLFVIHLFIKFQST